MPDAIDLHAREQIAAVKAAALEREKAAAMRFDRVERDIHGMRGDVGEIKEGIGKILVLFDYEVKPTQEKADRNERDITVIKPKLEIAERSLERINHTTREEGETTREKIKFWGGIIAALFALVGILGPLIIDKLFGG